MPAKSQDTKIDRKQLLAALTKGFQTKPTKRGGQSGFTLIQHEGERGP